MAPSLNMGKAVRVTGLPCESGQVRREIEKKGKTR